MDKSIDLYLGKMFVWGTVLATSLIAVGVLGSQNLITMSGIAVFIILPILRVIVLLFDFFRSKDKLMTIVALSVLMIITLSMIVGFYFKNS